MQDSSQVMHILLRTSFKKVKQYRTFVPPMSGGLNLLIVNQFSIVDLSER